MARGECFVRCRRLTLKQMIANVAFASAASGQPQSGSQEPSNNSNGSPARLPGVHVYSVAVYGSYYSSLLAGGSPIGYDFATGGSATVGWTKTRPRSSVFLSYTSTYARDI